jgi:SAM-dependent methyltransferase
MTKVYPLGTGREELERLTFQHRLWSDAAHALWRRAGIGPGSRVLDVGAGPGAASFDLAQLVTSQGRVLAVDASDGFIAHIGREAIARGLEHLEARVNDVHELTLDERDRPGFDVAYARWVLCFSHDPAQVVRAVASMLCPGGLFCVHDYFNYAMMTTAPRRASYTEIVQATERSWRDNGGDPDIVARLPGLFADAGLELVHLDVHQRIAQPGEPMWHWARTWWNSYAPKLVATGYVSEDRVRELFEDLDAMRLGGGFMVLPPVFELIGRA